MCGSWPPVLLLFILISYLGLNISLKSSYFFCRNFETDAVGGKVLELQTLRVLSCAVLCHQNDNCSFISHTEKVCSGYSQAKAVSVEKSSAVKQPMFRVSPKREKLRQDDYRALGSSGKFVKLHDDRQTWTDALQTCQAEGATLVKLDSLKIRSLYAGMFYSKRPKNLIWIGLSDKYDNDTWYWTDGSPLRSQRNWKMYEPDNVNNGIKENCVVTDLVIFLGVQWIDSACNATF